MKIEHVKELIQPELTQVDELILSRAQANNDFAHRVIAYILENGGKRLRPMLVLLCARALRCKQSSIIAAAALIECFHTATLLHDDVVDNSSLRRGKQTVNTKWDNRSSILVGDYLYALSVQFMTEINNTAMMRLLSEVAGQITSGELRQLEHQYEAQPSLNNYLSIIRDKTAVLFAASCAIPAILNQSSSEEIEALYQYGLHLGNAFQLVDDTLDYCQESAIMGKNAGDDLADGKATMPLLYLLEHGSELQKKMITHSLSQGSREHFSEILNAIESSGAIEYTRAYAKREMDSALSALAFLPESENKTALETIAYYALERQY